MLSKTRGVVLHVLPYNDTSSILHVYTESFGRASYLVARQSGRKTRIPHAFFLPLSVIEMDVEHLPTRDIQRIREVKPCYLLTNIPAHPIKNVLALFLSEFLFRVIRTKESDTRLFEYLYDSIRWLELAEEGIANFHLVFLIHLVRYLGIYPNAEAFRKGRFFDMMNGVFTDQRPTKHLHYLDTKESIILHRLLRMNYTNMAIYTFSRYDRLNIIRYILEYYRLHLSDFPEIKSLAVMQNLFD